MANYRVKTIRGPNMVDPQCERLQSADGSKWATGRNVKCETSEPGRFGVVKVWTLKARNSQGKVVSHFTGMSRAAAMRWCRLDGED